jgi:glycosyltransferase involved in cell wall biosynthesis
MNLVINTRPLSKYVVYNLQDFVNDYIFQIINNNPTHSFYIIADSVADKFVTLKNISIIASAPTSANILLWKLWYAYKLPSLLKKYKADVFINMDSICSLKTKVPQCIVVPDLSFLQHPAFVKKNTSVFLKKAVMIITFSQFVKNLICKNYTIATEKVEVIYTGANENFLPVDEVEKENCKGIYTEGKEYFLFAGELSAANNLVNLLKAFSFFKKRQKSNMQLIIATKAIAPNNPLVESLKTYKYRNEVKLLIDLPEEELVKITAAAYAFVYAVKQHDYYAPVLLAMQSEVPVIVSNSAIMTEICGETALFTDPAIFENIADKMMMLFKNEDKRNELIIKGKQQAAKFPLATTNQLLWQSIVKCAGTTN